MRRLLTGALLAIIAIPAHAAGIDDVDGPIAATAASPVYGAADVPGSSLAIDLGRFGYVEEEYFIAGTANSYRHQPDGSVVVDKADIPYVTRMIVRRPADRSGFSGVVHFEPIHPSRGGTLHWQINAEYMMRRGDAYVAVAMGDDAPSRRLSKGDSFPSAQSQVTKWFDPERYAPLDWPEEDGIRYQVLAQVGRLIRSDRAENPLRGWPVKAALVGGWSFTGSVQRSFINEGFHERERLPDGAPIFDGYLIGISSRWNGGGYIPLNSSEGDVAKDDPRRTLKDIDVPVIEFMSEFEVATGPGAQKPDSDAAVGAHRLYQMGGTIHSSSLVDPTQPRIERPQYWQLAGKGYPADRLSDNDDGCDLPISDVDHPAYARAVLDALRRWVLDDAPAPHMEPLSWQGDKIARDKAGNPLGGLRAAEFEVPLAGFGAFTGEGHTACVAESGRPIFVRNPLSQAELVARYGSRARYLQQFDAEVAQLVAERWLLEEDAVVLRNEARSRSYLAFGVN